MTNKKKAPKIKKKIKGYLAGGETGGVLTADQFAAKSAVGNNSSENGAGAGIAAAGAGLAGEAIDTLWDTNEETGKGLVGKGIASGAAKGAGISAMLGGADFGASILIGGAIGGLKGKKEQKSILAANAEEQKLIDQKAEAQRIQQINDQTSDYNNSTQMVAKGGPIKGYAKGSLSDSAFIVPEENAQQVNALLKKNKIDIGDSGFIKGPGHGTSDSILVKKRDGGNMAVSNGEFTIGKSSLAALKGKGIDVNAFAPNQDTSENYAEGGPTDGSTVSVGGVEYKFSGNSWKDGSGNEYLSGKNPEGIDLNKEFSRVQKVGDLFDQLGIERDSPKGIGQLTEDELKAGTKSKIIKTIQESTAVNNLGSNYAFKQAIVPDPKTAAILETPGGKAKGLGLTGKTPAPTDNLLSKLKFQADVSGDQNVDIADLNAPVETEDDRIARFDKYNNIESPKSKGSALVNKTEDIQEKNKFGGFDSVDALGLAQASIGLTSLLAQKNRPVDSRELLKMDPNITAATNKALSEAAYGFDAATMAGLESDTERIRRAGVDFAANTAGGNFATSQANARASGNAASKSALAAKAADATLKSEKSRAATQMQFQAGATQNQINAQNTAIQRQKFEDKLMAFKEKQAAGSALLNAGINNVVGNQGYKKYISAIEKTKNTYINRP